MKKHNNSSFLWIFAPSHNNLNLHFYSLSSFESTAQGYNSNISHDDLIILHLQLQIIKS